MYLANRNFSTLAKLAKVIFGLEGSQLVYYYNSQRVYKVNVVINTAQVQTKWYINYVKYKAYSTKHEIN